MVLLTSLRWVVILTLIIWKFLLQFRSMFNSTLPKINNRFIHLMLIFRWSWIRSQRWRQSLRFIILPIFTSINQFPILFHTVFFIIINRSWNHLLCNCLLLLFSEWFYKIMIENLFNCYSFTWIEGQHSFQKIYVTWVQILEYLRLLGMSWYLHLFEERMSNIWL